MNKKIVLLEYSGELSIAKLAPQIERVKGVKVRGELMGTQASLIIKYYDGKTKLQHGL